MNRAIALLSSALVLAWALSNIGALCLALLRMLRAIIVAL